MPAILLAALVAGACTGTSAEHRGPLPAGDVARGEPLYQANCTVCHGADLGGAPRGPALLDPIYLPDQHPDSTFVDAVRNGVPEHDWSFGPMPVVGGLSTDDIADIVAFVRAQQRAAGLLEG